MKINEIASRRLDEAPPGITPAVKYVGPYFDKAAAAAAKAFGVGKGTTQAELDALRTGNTGAAKAAGGGGRPPSGDRPLSTVSPDELNALLYPPAKPAPTVDSFLKRRGDPGFDPDLYKNKALPPGFRDLPPADLGATIRAINNTPRPSASGPKPRPRPAEPELGNMEPPLQAGPAAAEIGQVRPGAETAATAAADSTAAGVPRYTMDEIRNFQELLRTNPAAAEDVAKKMGLPAKLFLGAAGVGALAAAPTAINAVRPGTVPDWANPVSYATKGAEKVLAPKPLPPEERIQRVAEPETDRSRDSSSSSTAPNAPAPVPPAVKAKSADEIPDDDPRVQELMRQLEKNGKLDESTVALDRMIYLSKL